MQEKVLEKLRKGEERRCEVSSRCERCVFQCRCVGLWLPKVCNLLFFSSNAGPTASPVPAPASPVPAPASPVAAVAVASTIGTPHTNKSKLSDAKYYVHLLFSISCDARGCQRPHGYWYEKCPAYTRTRTDLSCICYIERSCQTKC